MKKTRRAVKHGFSFYLGISLLVHFIILIVFSFINFPEIHQEKKEILPVKIRVRQPLSGQQQEYLPDWLSPGEFMPARFENRVAGLARLPDFFRWAPAPPTPRRIEVEAKPPRPQLERKEFTPPESSKPAPGNRVEEKPVQKVDNPRRPEVPQPVEPENTEDLLAPGEEKPATGEERQLLRRPSFPYVELRDLLPSREVQAQFTLTVNSAGEVTEVEISESTGSSKLDGGLVDWIKKWAYNEGAGEDKVEIEIEIPAE
ncbi:MAG: hypothetical protein ACQEP7_01100 [bacterium]